MRNGGTRLSLAARGGLLKPVIDGQELQPGQLATCQDKGREVNRVERAEWRCVGHGAGRLADPAADFPELATGPDPSDISLGVRESFFSDTTERAQAHEGSARFDEGQAGRDEDGG